MNQPLPISRNNWRMISVVTRRELRDASRDWRIIIPIVLLTLAFPFLMNITAQRLVNFTNRFGGDLIANQLIPFLLLVVGFFPTSFSLVIALETFVGEKERKSLEPLLATPLTNTQLYIGKMLAALVPPLLASFLGMGFYLFALRVTIGWVPTVPLFIQTALLTIIQGVIMVAAAVVVSSQTTSVRAANLLASFIIVPMALLIQGEAAALFWGNHAGLWWLIVALGLTAVILIRMGISIFNREELLGRDIDQIRLGWMFGQFWQQFSGRKNGRYPNPVTWYKQTFTILPQLRFAILSLLLVIVGSLLLGRYFAQTYPLSPALQAQLFNDGELSFIQGVGGSITAVFFNNLRLITLIALVGMFTLGVLGIVVFGTPWLMLGFWLTQLSFVGEAPSSYLLTQAPHGLLELIALLLAAAAALRWHVAAIVPQTQRTISENFLAAAGDFMRICIGVALPLLFIAAIVELQVG